MCLIKNAPRALVCTYSRHIGMQLLAIKASRRQIEASVCLCSQYIDMQLLAVKASRRQIEAVLVAAGAADESGEIGYDAYVQAMSTQLFTGLSRKKKVAGDSANSEGGLLSFDTQVNKYKR